jgi:GH24 family phage-related lysozyme (muramidase)
VNRALLKIHLVRDEADRRRPYKDSEGILSIGIGRNLEAKPLSDAVVRLMLDEDIDEAVAFLDRNLPWWSRLDEPRQGVLANMAFNMNARLLGFKRMLAAAEAGRYSDAASEMLNSKWAGQVGERAVRLAETMRDGRDR